MFTSDVNLHGSMQTSNIVITPVKWLERLECTLYHTLDPEFESHQCLYVYNYVDSKASVAMLAIKRSSVVAPEVYLRNTLHTGDEVGKQKSTMASKPRAEFTRNP